LGEEIFPVLKGWPNQGVGRLNPDGSKGSCTSCHPRHDFSIETARKPYTCSECHKGPDVPVYKIYQVSKHGNIFNSQGSNWNYNTVPWKIGEDFTAPTCAACHSSLIVNADNEVIAKRTHEFGDRLAWRLFGLIYAHPHPKSADVTGIKNSADLPLPTELSGEPVKGFLINEEVQAKRNDSIQKICLSCHSAGWVKNHFIRLDNSIKETNHNIKTATNLLSEIWKKGLAAGLPKGENPFDEAIEREWVSLWLIHGNSIRLNSAMAGGGDYGVFADGRYQLTKGIYTLLDFLKNRTKKY
jgi:hypothetical protein